MNTVKLIGYFIILTVGVLASACGAIEENKLDTTTLQVVNNETEFETSVDGYDITSYFDLESVAKGDPKISAIYQGAKWYFSSEENKKKFEANAAKYLPFFDEYCPVSLSQGKLIKGKPKYYVVYKDRLYFFYNKKYADEFEKDPESYLAKAKETWGENK